MMYITPCFAAKTPHELQSDSTIELNNTVHSAEIQIGVISL